MHDLVPLKAVLLEQKHEHDMKHSDRINRNQPREFLKHSTREKHFYEVMVSNAMDIMTIIDADGVIQYMNPAAERVIGYAPEEMLGQELFEYLHPNDIEAFDELLDICADSPGANLPVMELRLQHKSGAWRWMKVHSKDLQFDETISGIFMDFRDITEYKERVKSREEVDSDL